MLRGEYSFILHSDDLFMDKNTIDSCVKYMQENPSLDAIISDLCIIDKDSIITGMQRVKDYK